MIFDFTEEEREEAQAIEDAYDRLIGEREEKLKTLRPDPEPDYKKISKIEKKINALEKPQDYEDNPESPEAKKYRDAYQRFNEQINAIVDEWSEAGNEEWQKVRVEINKIKREKFDACTSFYRRAEERYASSLGSLNNVYREAIRQIRMVIESAYQEYESRLEDEYLSFTAYDVRRQDDGGFLLDTTETEKRIERALAPLIKRLKAEDTLYLRFKDHLRVALATSPYVSSTGVLWGEITRKPAKDENAVRPDKHVTTLTRVAEQAFKNELIRPLDADPNALWDIPLNGENGNVIAQVAIDYTELIESGVFSQLPKLSGEDLDVHDAIITLWYAGNRVMTYDMIYRAMTGKMTGKVHVSDDIYDQIEHALRKFGGRVQMSFHGVDRDKNEIEFIADESIIFFRRKGITINGKYVARAIEVIDEPVFLRWAKANRNELDTRDIKLLDVPKLNNGKESAAIRRILYRRIVKMRREFEVAKKSKAELPLNRRRIRYDYLYSELGLDTQTLTKDKRHDIKTKVDRCLDYWTTKDLIAGYEHVRDSARVYYGIDLSFLKK